jgi:hypothetical protein
MLPKEIKERLESEITPAISGVSEGVSKEAKAPGAAITSTPSS